MSPQQHNDIHQQVFYKRGIETLGERQLIADQQAQQAPYPNQRIKRRIAMTGNSLSDLIQKIRQIMEENRESLSVTDVQALEEVLGYLNHQLTDEESSRDILNILCDLVIRLIKIFGAQEFQDWYLNNL